MCPWRDQLAGLPGGEREPEPQHDGVEPGLEPADHLLAGDAVQRVAWS